MNHPFSAFGITIENVQKMNIMKPKMLMLITVMAFSAAVSAQGIRVGVKAGASLYKIDGQSFSQKFQYGYHLGGFVKLKLNSKWSIQPEVLFNQQNTTLDSNFKSLYSSVINPAYVKDVKLHYLSIPLMVNYKLNGFMSLQAGPQFGILIDSHKNLLQNGGEAFGNGDFSLVGGLVLHVGKFSVNGRYAVGMKNINDIDNRDKWKSQSAQVSLAMAF
jgi:hypothetical protein